MKTLSMVLVAVAMFATVAAASATTVVFVGGWNMGAEQMEKFSRSIPDQQKITVLLPSGFFGQTLAYFADPVYNTLKEKDLLEEDLVFVAFSYGGVLTEKMLEDHPELRVKKLILVGSPVGGFRMVPRWPAFSHELPEGLAVYVAAGVRSRDVWFLGKENDGAVDLVSALAVPEKNLVAAKIYPQYDHSDLYERSEVQDQIGKWIADDPQLVTVAIAQ